jgi:hypothetical protein
MKPIVFTPFAFMWMAIASAISESLCGVLNTHFVLGLAGSTMRAEAAIEIIGVSASATTSTIASELGRDGRADHHVDLVLGDELFRVGDGLGRVGAVVEDDPVDLLARRSSSGGARTCSSRECRATPPGPWRTA